MWRKTFLLFSILLFSGWLLGGAQAVVPPPVDTGPGPSSGTSYLLNSSQWGYAAKFTLTRMYDLLAVLGWMEVTVPGANGVVTIYNDDGDGPYGKAVPGSKRFSGTFYLDNYYPARWAGVWIYLAPWRLPGGTYWVAFEVKDPSLFAANLYTPAPSPLSAYARSVGDHYEPAPDLNFGVRIYGNPVPDKLIAVRYLLLD